jgi:uncharacterized protein YndB with AHSA1/START domain
MDVVRHGVLNQFGELWTLRYERELGHPPDRVWAALTDPEQLKGWFPTGVAGGWTIGAQLEFTFSQGSFPAMHGTVLQAREPHILEYTWGPDTLLFELTAGGTGTHLELVVGLEELGKAARDGAGWHEALDLLETCLDGDERWPLGERWGELAPVYAAAFGPAAAAIGPPEGWNPPGE